MGRMARDPRDLLPLKPVVFQILLVLADGERHGWSLVHALQQRTGGERLLPGNFYRVLKAMLAEGLIEDVEPSRTERELAQADTGANADRRRYVRLTPFGRDAARAEARRLEALVVESRARRLLSTRRSPR
jgi:DNA-binding PadR family transcriptional regulator